MSRPQLVLGPLLRHVGTDDATVWVETDAACTVEVLGCAAPTFQVAGHHYALVHVTGLPDARIPYEVHLDGERAWPALDDWPPSTVRAIDPQGAQTICFGSCRVGAPHAYPFDRTKDEHPEGRETDALRALALRMRDGDPEDWPELMLFLGDQVYADEISPAVRAFIEARRDLEVPPNDQVADFEEYTRLYHESWGEPHIRWLLSVVPTAMIFDDHDVHDDWNTSDAWVRHQRGFGWWDRRIVGGFASYWLYQHLGNLAPAHLADDATWEAVRACEGDAWPELAEFAWWADREVAGTRWSYCRDVGRTRIVMVDSRAGRVLRPGARSMVDEDEWKWIEEHVRGDCDHLVIGTSLPLFLRGGLHALESWNEAVADGAWGRTWAALGEQIRRGLDLEHWPAFRRSFERMCATLEAVARGERGAAPASVVVVSGDVHHAYLAEVGFRARNGARGASRSPVWQAVCSPFRNPLSARERRIVRWAGSPAAGRLARGLARLARVPAPPVAWKPAHREPWFDNQVATLHVRDRRIALSIEKVDADSCTLHEVFARELHA